MFENDIIRMIMLSIHNLKAAASISAADNCCIFNFLLEGTEKNGFSTSTE